MSLAKDLRRSALVVLAAGALALGAAAWGVVRAPAEPVASPLVVNDVTQLNPITVGRVIVPRTTQEIVDAVRTHDGPISVGGARHSMGGQIATPGALYIDMREFDKILAFSPEDKTITVQAGARWRQIQESIDPSNLSVAIMQTYANFTVGGSLSVNAHGRYVGGGPLISSARSLKVVLADGSVVEATPDRNEDVFYGAIGGYGGIGVITEATLELTDDVRIKRRDRTMPVSEYARYFDRHVRGSSTAVLHNGDIYPNAYDTVRVVTFERTDDPVTVEERLVPEHASYRLHRLAYWVVSDWPLGKTARRRLIDPILYRGEPVSWLNHEASYDTAELEPASRVASTYALEEYFVPVDRFDEFVTEMRNILRRHDPNVINVSIRHASRDPGSLLAWARTDVFSFVIYYKQGTTDAAKDEVGAWTRELIAAAVHLGGAYYLPYQLHATETQFLGAYPRANEYFALKRRLDPGNKFRNELLDRYDPAATIPPKSLASGKLGRDGHVRD
jgi:FAD/FMN-containing dehydrogenase